MPNINDQDSAPNGKSVYPFNVLGKFAAKPFYIWVNDDCSNKSDSFTEAKAVRLELFNDGGATAYIVDADGVEVVDAEIEAHEVLAKHDYFAGARKPEIRPDCSGAFMVNDPQDPDGYAIVGDDIAALILEARDHLLTKSPVRDLPISTEKSSCTADAKSSHVDGEVIGIDGDGCLIQWDGQAGVAYNSGHDAQGFGMDNLSQLEKERLNLSVSGLASFDYQLLARLQQDCDYYLGHGNRSKKHLWAGGEAEQIAKMKELYSGLKEKPEWISLDDIDTYEARMLNFVTHPSSGKTGTFAARFDQHADRNGQTFTLIGTVDSGAYDKAECGEMFVVRFADGVEIHAWPEEVQSALNAVDGKAQLAFDQKLQGKVEDRDTTRMSPAWSNEHRAAANNEGWDIWDTSGSESEPWQIQRFDESHENPGVQLDSDDDALRLVVNGSAPHHEAARLFIKAHSTQEWSVLERAMQRVGKVQNTAEQKVESALNRGVRLRSQALALLQEAQSFDGLKPFTVTHTHSYGESTYVLWAAEMPTQEHAKTVLDCEFEPEREESLAVEDGFTLEEMTGVALTARLQDILDRSELPGPDDSHSS